MNPVFSLESSVFSESSLVLEFTGQEYISQLFNYSILVADIDPNIEFESAFGVEVTLNMKTQNLDNLVKGVISEIELTNEILKDAQEYYVYRITVVPDVWYWTLNVQNKVYQNLALADIGSEVFTTFDPIGRAVNFSFENQTGTETKEFVIQYKESDFSFISRLAEHEGVFYFFKHSNDGSQIVFGDDNQYFVPTGVQTYAYTRDAGPVKNDTHLIFNFTGARKEAQASAHMLDYNYSQPTTNLASEAATLNIGKGEFHEFSPNYLDTGVGNHLAAARAASIEASKHHYKGNSNSSSVRAGSLITMSGHYRDAYNAEYLVTSVRHRGEQRDMAAGGATYKNEFTAIPSAITFRPGKVTPKPKLYGVMTGTVVGSQMHGRAEIDDQGRYKIRLPFDISGSDDADASCYIRMAQAYGGPQSTESNLEVGMHFPLLPGTEVIWSCIDGDLDRPVINGIVPNPNAPSTVKEENHQNNVLRTTSGISMTFNDGIVGKPAGIDELADDPLQGTAQKVPTYTGDQGTAMSIHVPDQWGQKTGLRLGGTEELTDPEAPVRDDQAPYYFVNAGWYDYTDGDHVSYTKGKRMDMVDGGNYDFLLTDGAENEDGTRNIIKHVHYNSDPNDGWKKIEFGGENSVSMKAGYTESYWAGYTLGATLGLENSINYGGSISLKRAFDFSVTFGNQLSVGATNSISVAGSNESTAIESHEWYVTPESKNRKDKLEKITERGNLANAAALAAFEGVATLTADHISSLSTGFGFVGQSETMIGSLALLANGMKELNAFREESVNKSTSYFGLVDGSYSAYTGHKVEDASWLHLTSGSKKYATLASMENAITVGKFSKIEGVVIQSTKDNEIIVSKDQATIAIGKKARVNVQKDCVSIKFGSNLLQVSNKGIHITGDLDIKGGINVSKNIVAKGKVKSANIVEAGASAKSVSKASHKNKQGTGDVFDKMTIEAVTAKSKGNSQSVEDLSEEAPEENNKKKKKK